MRFVHIALIFSVGLLGSPSAHAEDAEGMIRKAAERSTLARPGTKPFHLKAEFAPTRERDRSSNRTGTIEIWWASPTRWKQEVQCPEFHQIAIVNGGQNWQKNEGDYYPEWLRELAVALVEPIPSLDHVLSQVRSGEVRNFRGMTNVSWMIMSTGEGVQKAIGAGLAIDANSGLLLYGTGFGWGGEYKDYQGFSGRMVARTVASGSPEVTARITTLEDLGDASGLFDVPAGPHSDLLQTVAVDETVLRTNLISADPPAWPALQDGPLEGALTTKIVVDRTGNVREVGTILADNPGVSDTAKQWIGALHFKPYLEGGNAVQVLSRITMPFKTSRPAGTEAFESARTYFERGRRVGFLPAGVSSPYVLHATLRVVGNNGKTEEGHYVDTWQSDSDWRREATFRSSRLVRAKHGEQRYLLTEGADAKFLRLAFQAMEPIPAIDTFVESDWKIRRDTVDGVGAVRVLTGYEGADGALDPQQSRAFWFDGQGNLLKAYFQGFEIRRSEFVDFNGVAIPHEVKVMRNGSLGMLIRVDQVAPAGAASPADFELPGHEWTRAFTDEVR